MPTHVEIETRVSPDHLFTITITTAEEIGCQYCDDTNELPQLILDLIQHPDVLNFSIVNRHSHMVAYWNRAATNKDR